MPVQGDLKTMALSDLLQWIGVTRKTGLLEIERREVVKRIEFRNGFIGSCSSDDRESQLGQYLLARGKITEKQLEEATRRLQSEGGRRLGAVLAELGLLSEKDVIRFVASNVEETIQYLFDWEDASFRFHEGATFDPSGIEVALQVSDILLRGIQFQDEIKQFRLAFDSSGAVLCRTVKPLPDSLLKREMTRRIFESIDGQRTIADILRAALASELLVLKFLYRLHQLGLVKVAEVRSVSGHVQTLLDRPETTDQPSTGGEEVRSEASGTDGRSQRVGLERRSDRSVETEAARRLIARDEYPAALELLHATFRACPGDFDVGNLLCEAEVGYVRSAGRSSLSPTSVPVRSEAERRGLLESEEAFLLSLIDGRFDVQSILSLATLREQDVVRTLEQMLEKGLIALRQPGPAEQPEPVSAG